MAGFKVIRDYLYERDVRESGKDGVTFDSIKGKEVDYQGGKTRVKVYDGDGILYYEAMCDGDDGAERFHDWASYDSGTTSSKIKDESTNNKWMDFIG